MTERTIRLTVSYDGTDFSGWQRQSGDRSVQAELERALGRMHGHPVRVTGAGRTDAGVHAAGQVAHFHTDIARIPAERFATALAKMLPPDVRVLRAEEADPDFHARYDARLRRYKYYMHHGGPSIPQRERFSWRLDRKPDLARLNRMAACLRGEVDCTAFASAKDPNEHKFRYLHHASFNIEGAQLVFDVAANAFLWRMVRSLVGTLVSLDASGAGTDAMREILESRRRDRAGVTAPPRGLFLWNVDYYDRPTRRGRHPGPVPGPGNGPRLVPGVGWLDGDDKE